EGRPAVLTLLTALIGPQMPHSGPSMAPGRPLGTNLPTYLYVMIRGVSAL
ncbi:hypothetical protein LCGC14_2701580, partial [marine sediment metagenome]